MINIQDKLWNLFMSFNSLIANRVSETGLDLYGTEQKINMAMDFVMAHQIEKLTEAVKEQTTQNAYLARKK